MTRDGGLDPVTEAYLTSRLAAGEDLSVEVEAYLRARADHPTAPPARTPMTHDGIQLHDPRPPRSTDRTVETPRGALVRIAILATPHALLIAAFLIGAFGWPFGPAGA